MFVLVATDDVDDQDDMVGEVTFAWVATAWSWDTATQEVSSLDSSNEVVGRGVVVDVSSATTDKEPSREAFEGLEIKLVLGFEKTTMSPVELGDSKAGGDF